MHCPLEGSTAVGTASNEDAGHGGHPTMYGMPADFDAEIFVGAGFKLACLIDEQEGGL
jgi:hypothetical protein